MKRGIVGALAATLLAAGAAAAAGTAGETTVLKWKDGKKAVFLLAFDDSCQSHIKHAIPELAKRGLVGTFYINPANGPFKSAQAVWEKELPRNPAVVYGNHTFSHVGATNTMQLDTELARCDAVIKGCYPERRVPFLLSFGRPGGVPWTVSEEEKRAALGKYRLVERPPFHGYPIHFKKAEQLCALVDQAIAKGEMGHHDFHGVGGDWLTTPLEVFKALLDKLEACREDVWVADHISYHKYLTERSSASVAAVSADATRIRLTLTSAADPALYDAPLSLETRVPDAWTACRVSQGATVCEVKPEAGVARYAAVPGKGEIVIERR